MNPVALLIPPSLDAKQALRLRRFGVSALSYVIATAMIAIAWMFGVLPASIVLEAAAAFVAINLCLYAAIRSGFNLRFADPSLTRFQMLAAITVLMYVVYQMDAGRSIALLSCFLVFLFGIFRLKAREFAVVTLYTLAAYAVVISLLMHWRPQAIDDVRLEWMGWVGLAGFLPCFNIIGGQINALRRRMRKSEARFRSLTEMSSDFYWESDAAHRLTDRNSPYLSPDDAGWKAHRTALDAHQPFRDFELSRLGADGTERHLSLSGDPVFDEAGAFTGYRGVGTDITARKLSEQALRDSAEKLRLFADNVPAMTVSWDENLRCRFANKVFAGFFGLAVADIIGKHAREVLGEEVYREIEGPFVQVLQGHPVTYRRICKLQNGESRHLEIKLLPHIGDQKKVLGCFEVTTDITEHKLAEERMQRVAHHDSLTGLPNRLLFNDRLAQAVSLAKRDSRQFALLYLDLDGFKPVNDALGHGAGDELLKVVGTRILRNVRESDTVARVGGDEFNVILHDIAGREAAQTVAGKVAAALSAPSELGGEKRSVSIGTSIGIAVYPADGQTADALVKAADAAMYSAKHARNTARLCAA